MQSVLRAPGFVSHGFVHGFSTRLGGVGTDRDENQRRFVATVGFDPERVFAVSQVHGGEVVRVDAASEPSAIRTREADGLVGAPGSGTVSVRTADCVPVLLADPETRQVAALHAGWRGLCAGVIGQGVRTLGVPPQRLLAALFPHIGPCCFEVGDDVAAQLQAAVPDGRDVVQPRAAAKPHVVLAEIALSQLAAAGLVGERIERIAGCTYCDPATFFSFRRDGQGCGMHFTAIAAG